MDVSFGQNCPRIVRSRAFLKKHRIATKYFDKTGEFSGSPVRAKSPFTPE